MAKIQELLKLISAPVIFASLCCLSPVIIVLLGLGTVSVAGSLADTLYGSYKWVFRSLGLVLLALSLFMYFRKKGICSLDQVRRHRNEVINLIVLSLAAAVGGYFFFLYIIVHYIGIWLYIWS